MGVPYRRSAWSASGLPLTSVTERAGALFASREWLDAIVPRPALAFNDAQALAFASTPFDPYQRPDPSGSPYFRPKTDGATMHVFGIALVVFAIVSALSAWLIDT
jgi:hypothetical protein